MHNKLYTLLILILVIFQTTVLGFTFPEPDWGALLEEKTVMVKAESFELYTEGPADSMPYYGAKFEPGNGVLFGMVAEYSTIMEAPISSYLTYVDMSYGQRDLYYPANEMIKQDNVIATVGFTIPDMNTIDFEAFRTCLDNLASYNKPMFIRFANEMNVSGLGNDPELYKEKFKIAANMIHEYENFAVVWSPNDLGALDRPFEYFYPGDEYVDWIGVSSYMKRFFQGSANTAEKDKIYFMIDDYAWHTNSIKPIVEFMTRNNINKPLMISEGGVSTHNSIEGNTPEWALPRIKNMYWNLIMEYPQIKLINYFNVYRGNEAEHYYISETPVMVDAANEALKSGAYIREFGQGAEFAFAKADAGYTLTAENGIVNVYTSAYIPNNANITVTYRIDGEWYHSSNSIPYKCGLVIESISDGKHTLSISSSTGESKEYTFFKNGDKIRFGSELEGLNSSNTSVDTTTPVRVFINGEELIFADQTPIIENGRTLVPMRAIFEKLGAVVEWNATDYMVTASKENKKIVMGINAKDFYVGNVRKELDVPAKILNGRTLVPVRAISEALDCTVEWNEENRFVLISE